MGVNEFIQIGNIIKSMRILSNYSQKEMASMLGIPPTTYSGYENGHREPPKEIIDKIANIFCLDSSGLIILGTLVNKAVQDTLNNISKEAKAREIVDNFISMNNLLNELNLDLGLDFLRLFMTEFFKKNYHNEKDSKELNKAIENELVKRKIKSLEDI